MITGFFFNKYSIMPATVFPATGHSFKIAATDDVSSNAATWYLNDLNTLTTIPNTSSNRTFYYENNNLASVGTFTSVRIFTIPTNNIIYDSTNYSIIGSDIQTSNFIPYYLNELNVFKSTNKTNNIITFFVNNTNLGNFVRVRIIGGSFNAEIDVVQITNNSFTIATPPNFPAVDVQLTVNIGRYQSNFIPAYSDTINITSSTNRTFNLTKPIGFPEIGSELFALIPSGSSGIADLKGITSTLTQAVIEKRLSKVTESAILQTVVPKTKGIKIELKNDRISSSFGISRSLISIKEPFIIQSRQKSVSTSTAIQYLNYPLSILGSDLVRNIDLSWYIKDSNFINLQKSTSSFVTYYFTNPNAPFNLGIYSKAKFFNSVREKIVDIVNITNNSITVLKSEEIPEVNQLSVFLGNIGTITTALLNDNHANPYLNYLKSSVIDSRSNISNSLINRSVMKVVGDPIILKTNKVNLQNFIREPIVRPSRNVTATNFTSTVFTNLIPITGRSGINTNFINYYIYDDKKLAIQKSTSSFVTLFFNNPNKNQSIGTISAVRLISSRFDITLSVYSYTTDSVTVADVLGFHNVENSLTINDLNIMLGMEFPDKSVTYSNNNITSLVEKFKTKVITTPNTLTVPKLQVSSVVKDTGISIRHTDFRVMTKVIGEPQALRTEQTSTAILQKTQIKIKEPIVLPSRTVTTSSFTNTIYSNPIRITGSTGITSNFLNQYLFDSNTVTLVRSTASNVVLYFSNPNNNLNIGNIVIARLISPRFDITVNVQAYTIDSIIIADIFNFNNPQSANSINDLMVRLGQNFVDRSVVTNDANRISLINPVKTLLAFNSRFDTLGNTKIRNQNFSTIDTPRVGFYKNIHSLRDVITYQPQFIVTNSTTSLIFDNLIDIGGIIKTTSSFVSYYLNENNVVTTYTSTNTNTTTLLFTKSVSNVAAYSLVKLFAYNDVDGNASALYNVTLPIILANSQSVTVDWQIFDYKIKVQFGHFVTNSGGTRADYNISRLAIANLNAQKFKFDRQHIFTISQAGNIKTANQKVTGILTSLPVAKLNQSIVVKGQGITILQRTTNVTTASTSVIDPFPIYVWGKTETTSTAIRWYYNEENILNTTNSSSSLVTLYFDELPIYQRTSAPFIKLFAPNVGYEYVYPVISATVDSVTLQNIGIFPSVSGMYFYWARQGQIESISYNDVDQIPQLKSQKFSRIQDPMTRKIYSSFTSTEQGFISYNRLITNINYVGSSTELTLNAAITIPSQGQLAKIQYVDKNYIETIPNNRRSIRFNGTNTFISFNAGTIIGALPSSRTPISAEAWINLDIAEGCFIMSEEWSGGFDPITLTLAIGNGPGIAGTRVWYGFNDGNTWVYAISNISLVAERWYHVAGQFDGNQIRIYIDGFQDGSSVSPANGWIQSAGSNFFIGRRYDTFSGDGQRPFFRGLIYQARVVVGQIAYSTNFTPPFNLSVAEYSGSTKFLACAFNIEQSIIQTWNGVQIPINYTTGGNLGFESTFHGASIPPRYRVNAYPEEIYEIESATSTKVYLKSHIVFKPITAFDVYFLGVSENFNVIRSTFTLTSNSFVSGNLIKRLAPISFGIEIPKVGKTLSIPKLKDTFLFSSKSVLSVNSVTQMTFSTIPLPVYGITYSTSTFVNYYINERNTLEIIPLGTNLVTLYLGSNPEYYRPLGTTVRIVNSNNGYDQQFNIVSSTIDSITIADGRDLPSVSGTMVFYGSIQTSIPSVNFSNSNAIGQIKKNTISQSWFESIKETSGQVKQSIMVRGEPIRFIQNVLNKNITVLRNNIEIPKEFKFSITSKIVDPVSYQNPVYITTTATIPIFYNPIDLGRIYSNTTFVTSYIYENNLISSITSTGTEKIFNLSGKINPTLGFDFVKIQGYKFDNNNENVMIDIVLPIASITTNTIAVNFPQPFPDLLYRASLGKTFTSYNQIYLGNSSISFINPFKTPVIENNQKPSSSGQLNKTFTILRDLQPFNNFEIGNYGKAKIKLLGDKTYLSTTTVSTSSSKLVYSDPVSISGTNRSTSTFVNYFIHEDNIFKTFDSTSSNVTLYFSKTISVSNDYDFARLTDFNNYDFTATILTVNSESITVKNSFLVNKILSNNGFMFNFAKIWPGETFVKTNNESSLHISIVNKLKALDFIPFTGKNGIEITYKVDKLIHSTQVKDISSINRFIMTPVRVITSLRAEKNADAHRTRTVNTTTSLTFEPLAFKVFGTNISTSTAVSWYLKEEQILETYPDTGNLLKLSLGQLPNYLQLQARTTHIRVVHNTGYDQQFAITNFTNDSVSINRPLDYPNISDVTLYFGSLRSFDTLIYNDTNTIAKLNFKWSNWHTHITRQPSYLDKSVIHLREHVNKTTGTNFLQKSVSALKGVIEVPKTFVTQKLINFREPIVLPSSQISYTTASSIIYYGPFLSVGKVYGTSDFLTNYLFDRNTINTNFILGNTATLMASDAILPVGQNFDIIKIEGHVTNLVSEKIDGIPSVVSFTTPGLYIYVIPNTVIPGSVKVNLWGGGGAGGRPGGWVFGSFGGAGGAANGVLNLAPGTIIYITVGDGGNYNVGVGNTIGGGGSASANGVDNSYGGGGGGYSGIFNSAIRSQASAVIIAGGGGGGGSSRAGSNNQGGSGGGLVGQDGVSFFDGLITFRGRGGTQVAAGADADSNFANTAGNQGALQGGNARTNSYGGGGGGGYWGGSGGGYAESNTMGGGGGGSGFLGAQISNGNLFAGNLSTPGNSTSTLRGNAGNAGGPSTLGNAGAVYIEFSLSTITKLTSPIEIGTKTFEATFPLTSFTADSVSFPYKDVMLSERYKFYLGKLSTETFANRTNSNQVLIVDKFKSTSFTNPIEVIKPSVLSKSSIVVKDFIDNIKVGKATAFTKIAGDRSYSVSTSTISHPTSTIFLDPVIISGINRSQTNFTQTYINDSHIVTVSYNTSTIVTLNFSQNIPYNGLANIVKIAKYKQGFSIGNKFFITNTEFEITYPIISYTNSSVTIDVGNNFSFIDQTLNFLAAYIGQNYQQPNSLSIVNTNTLAVSQLTSYRPVIGITAFALSPIPGKLSIANRLKGIEIPLNLNVIKPMSTAKLKGIAFTTATGKFQSIPRVVDNFYSNNTLKTNLVENFYTQTSVSTTISPVSAREMLYYSFISPIKFGRKITVYPHDAVCPINLIPDKTRTITTSSELVWNYQSFKIRATNLISQTNLDWFTNENNFINFSNNVSPNLVLYFGSLPYDYTLPNFSKTHIRLINSQGFDQIYPINTYTNDSVTIPNPISLPSISTLNAFFGSTSTIEQLIWNDQGLVSTFSSNLASTSSQILLSKIVLTGDGVVTIPNYFVSSLKLKEIDTEFIKTTGKIVQESTASIYSSIVVPPRTAKENLAVELLAPGLRYNKSFTSGIVFSQDNNNFVVNNLKTTTGLRSPTNLTDNTQTNFVFFIDSENTSTAFTASIGTSAKSIYYYTTLAPGIRHGISLPSKILAFNEILPNKPTFFNFKESNTKLISVLNPVLGNIDKQYIQIKSIPIIFDKAGSLKTTSLLTENFARPTLSFIDRSKLEPYGFNSLEVFSSGVIDKKFIAIKGSDFKNFTVDTLKLGLKVTADSNSFYGDQKIKLVEYLRTPSSRVSADNLVNAKIPSFYTQIFETPRQALLDKQFITIRSIVSKLHNVDKLSVVSKVLDIPFNQPVSIIKKTNFLDLRPIILQDQRGKIDSAVKLKDIITNINADNLQKSVIKLAFKDNDSLKFTQKFNIEKEKLKVFSLDETIGWMPKFIETSDLYAVPFKDEFGKIVVFDKIVSISNLEEKLFGQIKTLEKIGLNFINFNTTGKIRKEVVGISETFEIHLSISPTGKINKFIASKSGNLQDPSTKRTVPLQFWN